jgi:HD-GYP domain-containing protein (c-di-GMP phosphodiesterase class II)
MVLVCVAMTAAVATPTTGHAAPTEYSALPLAGVMPDIIPAVDLFLPAPAKQKPQLYRERSAPVDERDLHSLRSRGIDELWVCGSDQAEIAAFLQSNLAAILASEQHSPQDRVKVLNQVVSQTLRDTMSTDDPSDAVLATKELATHLVDIGMRSDLEIRDVARVASHDFCTFTHSANVATFCTLLAYELGVKDREELRLIASAGMLHDLGKLDIPTAILTKPGKLTKEEFEIIKLHPTRGFQKLRTEFTPAQLMIVYQHHEKLDGTGYPVGLVGDEIHYWGKIAAVADVYEALTGKRPYRRPNTSIEALTIMRRSAGTHFDAEMLRCWESQFVRETRA